MEVLFKNVEGDVPEQDPWSDDVLGRKEVAEQLSNIVLSAKQPFVIGVSAPFGAGKTFFVRRWAQQLTNDGVVTLYFNAWKTDFTNDPFVAFTASLTDQFKDLGIKSGSATMRGIGRNAAAYLVKRAVPTAVRIGTAGFLDVEEIASALHLGDKGKKELTEFASGIAQDSLNAHKKAEEAIAGFRRYLERAANEIKSKTETESNIVVFIDELDRCRPDYAIKLLEHIKHVFAVENYVFVLSVDQEQLLSFVSSIFGPQLDGDGYLRRLVDWTFRLPPPRAESYAHHLFNRFSMEHVFAIVPEGQAEARVMCTLFGSLADLLGASLRVQEQCFTEINIALRSLPRHQVKIGPLTGLLALLKAKHPEQYRSYCEGRLKTEGPSIVPDWLDGPHAGLVEFLDKEYSGAFSANENSDQLLTWLIVGAATNLQVLDEKAQSSEKRFIHLRQQEDAADDNLDKLKRRSDIFSAALRFYSSIPMASHKTTVAKIVMDRLEAAQRII